MQVKWIVEENFKNLSFHFQLFERANIPFFQSLFFFSLIGENCRMWMISLTILSGQQCKFIIICMLCLTILSGQQCKFIIICMLFSVFVTTKVIERNTLLCVICIRWPTMNKTFYTYLNALVKKAFILFLVQPAPSNPLRKFSIQSWWVRVYLFIY